MSKHYSRPSAVAVLTSRFALSQISQVLSYVFYYLWFGLVAKWFCHLRHVHNWNGHWWIVLTNSLLLTVTGPRAGGDLIGIISCGPNGTKNKWSDCKTLFHLGAKQRLVDPDTGQRLGRYFARHQKFSSKMASASAWKEGEMRRIIWSNDELRQATTSYDKPTSIEDRD